MKLPVKSLSILAIGGIFAGKAFAGPDDAYLGFHAASAIAAKPAKTMTERGVIEKVNPPRKQFAPNWLDSRSGQRTPSMGK
jgi:hypothetical protein